MSIPKLPFDVLDALCLFLDTSDLLSLALTSNAFTVCARKRLYRHLALEQPVQAERCLQTLASRPDLARHVRVFSLRLDPSAALFKSFVTTFARALHNMPLLTSLDVALPQTASDAFMARCKSSETVYERLSHFSCNLPFDGNIANFLGRTPSVSELHLGDYQAPTHAPASEPPSTTNELPSASHLPSLPSTSLPNLSVFWGPPDVAAGLVPGRPLESVHLYYGELSESVLDALGRSTSSIAVFGAFTHSLSPAILRHLAQSLPHVHHLRIMTMYHAASMQPDEVSLYRVLLMMLDHRS